MHVDQRVGCVRVEVLHLNKCCKIVPFDHTSGTPRPIALTLKFSCGTVLETGGIASHATCTTPVPSKDVDAIAVVREAQEVEVVVQPYLLVHRVYVEVPHRRIEQVALIVRLLPSRQVELQL